MNRVARRFVVSSVSTNNCYRQNRYIFHRYIPKFIIGSPFIVIVAAVFFFHLNSSGPPWNALCSFLVSSVLHYKKLIFASWTAPSRGLDGIPCSVSFSNSNKSTTMSPVDKDCLMESSWGLTKAPPPTASPSSSPIGLLDGEAVWG